MVDVDGLRARLAALPADRRCHSACPGWVVADLSRIQRCDDCARERGDSVGDDEVAALPEAQRELVRAPVVAAIHAQLEDLERDDRIAVLAEMLRTETVAAVAA